MKVKLTTANGRSLGTLVLNQRPFQDEYIFFNNNVHQIDKIIHEQNANFEFTILVKVNY